MVYVPVVSGSELVRALGSVGYVVVRQKGSHVRLRCESDPHRKPTTVPLHREIKRGTLLSVLHDAGLTVDEFKALLR